jgi:predicted RNA binding protein YcfA (HicA-like mRNA interferase family)
MLEWTVDDFVRMLKRNGYTLSKKSRGKGSHSIYINEAGNHISVPLRIKAVIARRLIKENNLNIDL